MLADHTAELGRHNVDLKAIMGSHAVITERVDQTRADVKECRDDIRSFKHWGLAVLAGGFGLLLLWLIGVAWFVMVTIGAAGATDRGRPVQQQQTIGITSEPAPDWLTAADAAERLNVSADTFRALAAEGKFPPEVVFKTDGGRWMVRADGIDQLAHALRSGS